MQVINMDKLEIRTSKEVYKSYRQHQDDIETKRNDVTLSVVLATVLLAGACYLGYCQSNKEYKTNDSYTNRLERVIR